MADIDMIPRSYRDRVRLRHTARRTGAALAVVLVLAGAGHMALRWSGAAIDRKAAALRSAAASAASIQARAATERDASLRAQQRAALLGAVRREGELAALAAAIDSSLPADAWLTALTLRRTTRAAPPGAALPAGSTVQEAFATGSADGAVLLLDSQVELNGQAPSYEGVTSFLARLGRIPGLEAVQLQSSGVNHEARAIEFQATLSLARPGKTP